MFESDLGREITNYVLVMLFSFQHCNKRFATHLVKRTLGLLAMFLISLMKMFCLVKQHITSH